MITVYENITPGFQFVPSFLAPKTDHKLRI